jgi:hypothetical protein
MGLAHINNISCKCQRVKHTFHFQIKYSHASILALGLRKEIEYCLVNLGKLGAYENEYNSIFSNLTRKKIFFKIFWFPRVFISNFMMYL